MKIAIIGSAHPLRGGGISTFNERMAEVLQQDGHEVCIYSFYLQYPSFLFPGKSQFTDEPAPAGLNIQSIINSVNPVSWIKTGKAIAKWNPDLIIVRYWIPFMGPAFGTILRIAKKRSNATVICIADNVLPHEAKPYDRLFTKYFIPSVDRFLVMSRSVLQDLKTFTNKPALYTPHPLYDNYGPAIPRSKALKKLGLPEEKKYLLFFGFIRKYKGLDLLLEAMTDERILNSDLQLILAGEYYGDRDFYEQIIQKNKLQNKVHLFTDFIPNEEVGVYFGASDVVLLPYRNATQSGITQVAYYFEKPMIATNVGGLPEAVPYGKAGLVCEPNPAAIADAIIEFFKPGALPDLAASLKAEKEQYSWKNFTEKLVAFAFGN